MSIKQLARYISLAAIFLIPIFALIVAQSMFFPFITGKAFYFRILVEIAFAAWVILAFADAKYRPRLTPLTISITVFALIALVADLLGANVLRSIWSNFERMEGWLVIVHLWMFFMATTFTFGFGEEGKKMWHRFLNTSLFFATIVGLYGLGQLLGLTAIHQSASRVDASLGNAAYMAVYMLIHAFVAIYLFVSGKKVGAAVSSAVASSTNLYKWVYPVLAIFFAFILFETNTRGTIIGLVGGVMLACFLYAVLGKGEKRAYRYSAGAVVIIAIVLTVSLFAAKNTSFVKNHDVLNRLASISLQEFKGEGRAYIWPTALKGWTQRPVLGWGQENFNYIFNANYNPAMYGQEQWFDRAHSVYLDWLVASGIVGLLAYLSLYILAFWLIWKSELGIGVKSVLTGLIVSYAIHNVFVFDNLASYVLFFSVLGLVTMLSLNNPKNNSNRDGSVLVETSVLFGDQPASKDMVEYVVSPIVIVLLVGGIYFLNVRPLQANKLLISALSDCQTGKASPTLFNKALSINSYMANQEIREQIFSCVGGVISGQYPNATKQEMFNLAVNAIESQIKATPKDARMYSLGGSFLLALGQTEQALPKLETANILSPRKQSIIFDLAGAYINSGQQEKALPLLKAAYESAPESAASQLQYALVLVLNNQEETARKLFHNDTSIFESAEMAQVYLFLKQDDKAVAIYKKLAAAKDSDINSRVRLARAQYAASQTDEAIATLKAAEKDFPTYKDQLEAAIKEINK